MENRLNKLDELMDLAVKLIEEQREMVEENREIISEINYLYQRLNESECCRVCQLEYQSEDY